MVIGSNLTLVLTVNNTFSLGLSPDQEAVLQFTDFKLLESFQKNSLEVVSWVFIAKVLSLVKHNRTLATKLPRRPTKSLR